MSSLFPPSTVHREWSWMKSPIENERRNKNNNNNNKKKTESHICISNAALIIVKRFFSLQLYYKDIKSYNKSYRRDYNPRKHNQRHKKSFFRKRKTTTALRIMHAKTDNIKIIISNKANEMIEGFYDSLLQKYQKGLDESIKTASLLLIMLIYCPINIIK